MNDSLKLSIGRLGNLAKDLNEKALSEVLEPRVRAAYADAGSRLSSAVSEIEYLIELERKR